MIFSKDLFILGNVFNILDVITSYIGVFYFGLYELNSISRYVMLNNFYESFILLKIIVIYYTLKFFYKRSLDIFDYYQLYQMYSFTIMYVIGFAVLMNIYFIWGAI